MKTLTWGEPCLLCARPIQRGKPTVLLSLDKPGLVGIVHAVCAYRKHRHGVFWTSPPYRLSPEQVSFLVQFFPRLYALPGGEEPNSDLRRCVADLLFGYPGSLKKPLKCLENFRRSKQIFLTPYRGDLESDFLRFLGQVQRAAKENPLDVEIDLRKPHSARRRLG